MTGFTNIKARCKQLPLNYTNILTGANYDLSIFFRCIFSTFFRFASIPILISFLFYFISSLYSFIIYQQGKLSIFSHCIFSTFFHFARSQSQSGIYFILFHLFIHFYLHIWVCKWLIKTLWDQHQLFKGYRIVA